MSCGRIAALTASHGTIESLECCEEIPPPTRPDTIVPTMTEDPVSLFEPAADGFVFIDTRPTAPPPPTNPRLPSGHPVNPYVPGPGIDESDQTHTTGIDIDARLMSF